MDARRLITVLAIGTSVVGGREGADHELPRLYGFDRIPDFFDDAAILVPHRCRTVDGLQAAVWPQVSPTDARRCEPEHRVGWL